MGRLLALHAHMVEGLTETENLAYYDLELITAVNSDIV
jgi:hypothetical protein